MTTTSTRDAGRVLDGQLGTSRSSNPSWPPSSSAGDTDQLRQPLQAETAPGVPQRLAGPSARLRRGGQAPVGRPGRHVHLPRQQRRIRSGNHRLLGALRGPERARLRGVRDPRSRPDALKPSQGSSDGAPAQRGGHQIRVGPAVGSLGPCGGLTNAVRGQDCHAAAGQGEGCGGTSHRDRQGRTGRAGCAPDLRQPGHSQDPGHPRLAGPPPPRSTCTSPPDRLVLDQPGRTLIRAAHRPAHPPRGPQERRRPGA